MTCGLVLNCYLQLAWMAGCKTGFLCTLRDIFSYIIWRGHFWHPIWIFAKFWISQALWRFSSKSPISPKSPVSKGPLLASNSNRQRLAIFRHFSHFRHCIHFWTWMETYMEYFDKYAVLRSHLWCMGETPALENVWCSTAFPGTDPV